MAENAMLEFFEPLLDDDLSKKILQLLVENPKEEDYERNLEELIKFIEGEDP